MNELEEIQIIFKQEHEFEDNWHNSDDWSDECYELIKRLTYQKTEEVIETPIEQDKSDKTIISSLSSEAESVSSSKSAASLTHSCLKEISIRNSQFLNIYSAYPIPKDPGINEAFWILYPHPPYFKPDGVDKFFHIVKSLGLAPISSMRQQLKSNKVDLKYYIPDPEIIEAICKALYSNVTVNSLDLEEAILTEEACYYLSKLLLKNKVLNSLNLTSCKIEKICAMRLEEGVTLSFGLTDLNLNNCELGNEGFRYIAKAVANNTLLKRLDISKNKLDEESAISMQEMLISNDSLKYLNLSWNFFNTKLACLKLFNGLIKNNSLIEVDLSWNSMSKDCVTSLSKFMSESKNIEHLDITANRFTDNEVQYISKGLILNKSLKQLHMSKNPIGPNGVTDFIQLLATDKFFESPLLFLNLETYWAKKDVISKLDNLKIIKPDLTIKLGGILGNWTIIGPDLKELYFKIANYEAMKQKRKKSRKNFGHFVLSLADSNISIDNFMDLIHDAKIKISDSLIKEITKQFMVKKNKISQAALKESYMSYFPDIKLPDPPKLHKTKNTENNKKEKVSSKKKKGKSKKK